MDESDRLYAIKSREEIITFNNNSLQGINGHSDENISEEFARHFSIDDDDVVLLDQSQIIQYEVKIILDHLINNILIRENQQSQIKNFRSKRLLDLNNQEECSLNKKVRFNILDAEQQEQPLSTYLFVSETINSSNQSNTYTKFLYNLGFDLCLEQTNLKENSQLTETNKQTLIKHNKIFHQYRIYSCKYCSFQTNTIHVMDYHYRTPHTYHNDKYRCTYCSLRTYSLTALRRHYYKRHKCTLILEPNLRRYSCSYCSFDTHYKVSLRKHNKRCQHEQKQTCMANNLLAPFQQANQNMNMQIGTIKTKMNSKKTNHQSIPKANVIEIPNNNEIIEPILIELDHDDESLSRSSSDEDFIVSSNEETSSSTDNQTINHRDLEISLFRPKPSQQILSKPTKSLLSHSLPIPQTATKLSSLSKLLLLNGTPLPSYTSSPINSNKSPLIPIQPKPTSGADIYQMCNFCQCYIFKNDYNKHMNEKHQQSFPQLQQTLSTPIILLNNPITSIKSTIIHSNDSSQSSTTIFLLSTSTMNTQTITLNMIKCPWCDTNFEHIDIMTGHLMRYHRMTLAAAKVVVAEQMKFQSTSSKELSTMFQHEIEQIQKEFPDKIYWKISQPKVYLHQLQTLLCFVCHINVDDLENHLFSSHQIQLITMNTNKQCYLCGFHCDIKNSSLFEHQLRTHLGVCYSSVLKQFIRFEPPPPPLSRMMITKTIIPSTSSLTTYTEKKFGCRKCDKSSGLFIFEELVEHLRLNHHLNVKLHRRCIICQQTYLKGKEYNQHCLEHLNDEYPLIKIQRKYLTKR